MNGSPGSPPRALITDSRRRNLLWHNHLLSPGGTDQVADVVASLLALHATDPATIHLSVAARTPHTTPDDVTTGLYGTDRFVKIHAMRRTVFIVDRDMIPMLRAAVGAPLAATERNAVLKLLSSAALGDQWLDEVTRSVQRHLPAGTAHTGAELGTLEPRLQQLVTAPGRANAKKVPVGSRVLGLLAMDGVIERGTQVGSWRSNQIRWQAATPIPTIDTTAARSQLITEYLRRFAPATRADIQWWTGLGKRAVDDALTRIDTAPVALSDEGEALMLTSQIEAEAPDAAGAAFLPALDPTVMGWKERAWYLPPHMSGDLVDRTGNLGPTLWWRGQVVGGWGQDRHGTIRWDLLSPVPASAHTEIDTAAERMQRFLGQHQVRPRFRTPLESRLANSLPERAHP